MLFTTLISVIYNTNKKGRHSSSLVASTGQASDPIRSVATLLSPVFLLNSRHPLFRDTLPIVDVKRLSFSCQRLAKRYHIDRLMIYRAPLLPKLRGQFAEFLQHSCLYHLGLLDLSTSVGLGTVGASNLTSHRYQSLIGNSTGLQDPQLVIFAKQSGKVTSKWDADVFNAHPQVVSCGSWGYVNIRC